MPLRPTPFVVQKAMFSSWASVQEGVQRIVDADAISWVLEQALHRRHPWNWRLEWTPQDGLMRMATLFILAAIIRTKNPELYARTHGNSMQVWFTVCVPGIGDIVDLLQQMEPSCPEAAATFRASIPLAIWLGDIAASKTEAAKHSESIFLNCLHWDVDCIPYVDHVSTNEVVCRVFTPNFYALASVVLQDNEWIAAKLQPLAATYLARHQACPEVPLPTMVENFG